MTIFFPNLCSSCKRKKADDTCDAFPDGIPDGILVYGDSHLEPVPGDHGLTYHPDPKKSQFLQDWLSSNGRTTT